MAQQVLEFHDVFFSYDTATEPLFEDLTLNIHPGWTGVVGANGAGKTTLMALACGSLEPELGRVVRPEHTVYCPQRTDDPPEELEDLMYASDSVGARIRGQLGLEYDWLYRWETLSHGERKRAQLATALWREPDLLAVDEPTNHLDVEARALVSAALESYPGIGLLVSHDRSLLDTLCSQCLFLSPPRVTVRPGGITEGLAQQEREYETARKEYEAAREEAKRLRREADRRRRIAESQQKRRSKRGLALKDHDARFKRNLARITGKDGVGGKLLRQMDGRMEQVERKTESSWVAKKRDLGITMHGEVTKRDFLVRLGAQEIPMGEDRRLRIPEVEIMPPARIALVGPNGAGKSTLVRRIYDELTVPRERVVYIPQEITEEHTRELKQRIESLSNDELGFLMTMVSQLGSEPTQVIDSAIPSPGETRKLLIGLGLTKNPELLILDEPTNHMDLPSIQCVEEALSGCGCSLLLVSHDVRFLERLVEEYWRIRRSADEEGAFQLTREPA